jgi:soluble lytic murein transglycosylase-like protein
MGLMQLMPDTAKRFEVDDPFDPADNINGGTRYLRWLMQRFNGDLQLVLAAYNAGENAVANNGNQIPPYTETQTYVQRVLGIYKP